MHTNRKDREGKAREGEKEREREREMQEGERESLWHIILSILGLFYYFLKAELKANHLLTCANECVTSLVCFPLPWAVPQSPH